jgi:biopolymer transport protein ExbD
MAELQTNNRKQLNAKSRNLGIRIDLTPMVDLGFLLITFFIYTSTMLKQSNLLLNYPDNKPTDDKLTQVQAASVLHLILGNHNQIFSYDGKNFGSIHKIQNNAALYKTLQQHKSNVESLQLQGKLNSADSSSVFITPTNDCVVQNLATIIDALTLLRIKNYNIKEAITQTL